MIHCSQNRDGTGISTLVRYSRLKGLFSVASSTLLELVSTLIVKKMYTRANQILSFGQDIICVSTLLPDLLVILKLYRRVLSLNQVAINALVSISLLGFSAAVNSRR